jgi:hypothetical protein
MDQDRTQTTEAVAVKAEAFGIELIWIPKGATGKYQPLDKRVFGALKSKGRAKWRHEFAEHDGMGCTREIGAEFLFQSWSELSDSVVDGNTAQNWMRTPNRTVLTTNLNCGWRRTPMMKM